MALCKSTDDSVSQALSFILITIGALFWLSAPTSSLVGQETPCDSTVDSSTASSIPDTHDSDNAGARDLLAYSKDRIKVKSASLVLPKPLALRARGGTCRRHLQLVKIANPIELGANCGSNPVSPRSFV
jgi:hypothetical protein